MLFSLGVIVLLQMVAHPVYSRSSPLVANPCTPENLARGYYYHTYPLNPSLYVQCTEWGTPYLRSCPPESLWHPKMMVCVDAATGIPVGMEADIQEVDDSDSGAVDMQEATVNGDDSMMNGNDYGHMNGNGDMNGYRNGHTNGNEAMKAYDNRDQNGDNGMKGNEYRKANRNGAMNGNYDTYMNGNGAANVAMDGNGYEKMNGNDVIEGQGNGNGYMNGNDNGAMNGNNRMNGYGYGPNAVNGNQQMNGNDVMNVKGIENDNADMYEKNDMNGYSYEGNAINGEQQMNGAANEHKNGNGAMNGNGNGQMNANGAMMNEGMNGDMDAVPSDVMNGMHSDMSMILNKATTEADVSDSEEDGGNGAGYWAFKKSWKWLGYYPRPPLMAGNGKIGSTNGNGNNNDNENGNENGNGQSTNGNGNGHAMNGNGNNKVNGHVNKGNGNGNGKSNPINGNGNGKHNGNGNGNGNGHMTGGKGNGNGYPINGDGNGKDNGHAVNGNGKINGNGHTGNGNGNGNGGGVASNGNGNAKSNGHTNGMGNENGGVPEKDASKVRTTDENTSSESGKSSGAKLYQGFNPCLGSKVRNHPFPGLPGKYLECQGWYDLPKVKSCSYGQVWVQVYQKCVQIVPTTTTTTTTTTAPPIIDPDMCAGAPLYYLPHPHDSTKYIQCDQYGNIYIRNCGGNKIWDESYYACVGRNDVTDNEASLEADGEEVNDKSETSNGEEMGADSEGEMGDANGDATPVGNTDVDMMDDIGEEDTVDISKNGEVKDSGKSIDHHVHYPYKSPWDLWKHWW